MAFVGFEAGALGFVPEAGDLGLDLGVPAPDYFGAHENGAVSLEAGSFATLPLGLDIPGLAFDMKAPTATFGA